MESKGERQKMKADHSEKSRSGNSNGNSKNQSGMTIATSWK